MRHQVRCETPYPMHGANFVPPSELDLLPSHTRKENLHHLAFTRRQMGRFLITQTFRDLDRNQVVMPIDQHVQLHEDYGAPRLPRIEDIMDVIDEAYQTGEQLRYGSAHAPIYKPITPGLIINCGIEYGLMK